ncbi:FOG: WD40 repeat [Paenibacillus popilliae ATCC 14706]|uniref:FOG: WD40 repeat n=1 Tax=Paenibacillus popilliae ATCC 14706 TaxID=1212764 RepID=M9M0P9_PAEPP|nr:hypothetical protein [Paenibacillus popilliae ATCC 14706]GAC42419.1 FOG: WD40 repeat [Paenibacillus popilliae ATCC 14706]
MITWGIRKEINGVNESLEGGFQLNSTSNIGTQAHLDMGIEYDVKHRKANNIWPFKLLNLFKITIICACYFGNCAPEPDAAGACKVLSAP